MARSKSANATATATNSTAEYEEPMTAAGLRISGSTPMDYVEMIELPEHPHFIGCQFHPEFQIQTSRAAPIIQDVYGRGL